MHRYGIVFPFTIILMLWGCSETGFESGVRQKKNEPRKAFDQGSKTEKPPSDNKGKESGSGDLEFDEVFSGDGGEDKSDDLEGGSDADEAAEFLTEEGFVKLEKTECVEGENLVRNSDFEQGNVEFTTEYTFDSTCRGRFSPGEALQYSVNSTPSVCHEGYYSQPDDRGQMLVVNLPAAGQGERSFWCQNIDVEKNRIYQISVRLRRAANNGQESIVEWTLDDTLFTQRFSAEIAWSKFIKPWRAPESGKVKLCGRAITQNTESGDLIVDDLLFRHCG